MLVPQRRLMGNRNQQDDDSEDYSKKFEQFVSQSSGPRSDKEKEKIEKEKQAKEEMDAAQAKQDEIDREKQAERKAQDFEDLLSGKKQADSEKNLQTIFKEFYAEAKKIEVKDYMQSAKNSATSSIGSLSSTLEKRR